LKLILLAQILPLQAMISWAKNYGFGSGCVWSCQVWVFASCVWSVGVSILWLVGLVRCLDFVWSVLYVWLKGQFGSLVHFMFMSVHIVVQTILF
jgi:hypothetical protein